MTVRTGAKRPTPFDTVLYVQVLVATLTVTPEIPIAGMALIVGIDRFMSEMGALLCCSTHQ
jgi:Na+/H+-dicarboxylate symporter